MMSHRRPLGFTLIEVMVVIVIIGVMASMIVVSVTLGDPQRELRTEAERLRTVLALAAEEAVIQQSELGAEFTESGYRFLKWEAAAGDAGDPNSSFNNNPGLSGGGSQQTPAIDPDTGEPVEPKAEWVVLGGDEILREYELPEGMRMLVEVDFEAVDIAGNPREKSRITTEDKLVPTLVFLSSGESSPFRIELFSETEGTRPLFIEGSVIGQVEVFDERPR